MPNVRLTVALALAALALAATSCASESAPDAPATTAPIATATPSGDIGTPIPLLPGALGQPITVTPPPADDPGYPVVEEPAPIERVEVGQWSTVPPAYTALVVSGLPNGCASFSRYDVERAGTTVRIEVFNTVLAPGELIACTMIYGTVNTAVALGSDFDSGVTYTVEVNDVTTSFRAQ